MSGPALLMVAAEDVPVSDDWLSLREREVLSRHPFPRRHRDWRLGRWAAKQAILGVVGLDPMDVEILAAPDGAPEPFLRNDPAGLGLSISHRDGVAVALVCDAGTRAGCDLEVIEPRSRSFVTDWFTPRERALVDMASEPDLVVTMIWSAKESTLKAIRHGLRLDTREVEIQPSHEGADWRRFIAIYRDERLAGWWRKAGRWVVTVVMDPATAPPVSMERTWKSKEKIR